MILDGNPSRETASALEAPLSIAWTLYILECIDGTFYTGIAKDVQRRLRQHNTGRASRYTRGRRPVKIIYSESCLNHSVALKKEGAVKALSKKEKQALITTGIYPANI